MALEYWLRGDIPPGPIKATVITEVSRVVETLKKFKGTSIILLGANLKNIEMLVNADIVTKFVELSQALNAPIITSEAEIVQRLDKMMFKNYDIVFPLELVRKLSRFNHNYKLVIMTGLRYAYEWLLLNHLKHYRPDINTFSLDPYAQPNATWTLPPLPLPIWFKNLTQIIDSLKTSVG